MCGIFGYFSTTTPASPAIRKWAEGAKRVLGHRGPDAGSISEFFGGKCILGHTRLSIIDIAGGAQPISNEDRSVSVVFNGEIYNYVELRQELKSRHHFRTESDTEVLVHLYEEQQDTFVNSLNGMFAFALLDERRGSVLLARDRFGEKPLYYAPVRGTGGWAFASELKALHNLPGIDISSDIAGIAQYLALGYLPAPRTHCKGIQKLRAGEIALLSSSSQRWKFWNLQFTGDDQRSLKTLQTEFRELLNDAVRIRLRSDVPVGAFLSGGIDSSLVVSSISEVLPGAGVRTYCAGFDDPLLDERLFAREVSKSFGTEHHEVSVSNEELTQNLWPMALHYDEPFSDYSFLPTLLVCKAARQDVKVVLTGDGADELFGGYRAHYGYANWHRLRRLGIVRGIAALLAKKIPKGRTGSGLFGFLGENDSELLRSSVGAWYLPTAVIKPEYSLDVQIGIEELAGLLREAEKHPFPYSLMQVQAGDLSLPDQLMTKVDRASMRVGLETRTPFLDHRLAEFAARLPARVNLRNGMGKMLLREALPAKISDATRWRRKRGFTPPMAAWLRTSLRIEMEKSLVCFPDRLQEIAETPELRRLFRLHVRGSSDHQQILFRWLALVKQFEAMFGNSHH